MMTHFMKRFVLGLAVLGLIVGAVGRARAGLTLTLDSTNPTFVIPMQGVQTFQIDGTATDTGMHPGANLDTVNDPILPTTPFPTLSTSPDPSAPNSINGTYTGPIVDVTVSSTDPIGKYIGGDIQLVGPDGASFVEYSVTLAPSVSSVPEPSTAIVAALGAVAFIACGWSRHRRDQRRQAAA